MQRFDHFRQRQVPSSTVALWGRVLSEFSAVAPRKIELVAARALRSNTDNRNLLLSRVAKDDASGDFNRALFDGQKSGFASHAGITRCRTGLRDEAATK